MSTAQQLAILRSQLAEHTRILAEISRIMPAAPPGPILSRSEAMVHVKKRSDTAFDRWCAQWRVRPCARGRYARGQLDRALLREASHRYRHKTAA